MWALRLISIKNTLYLAVNFPFFAYTYSGVRSWNFGKDLLVSADVALHTCTYCIVFTVMLLLLR